MHADGRHAQMVALAAAWNALCGALLRRSVPVLFAPVSDYFTGSKRQPAAWLATLIYSFAYAFGPLTGGMLRRLPLSHCLLSVLGTLCIGLGQAASFALTGLYSFVAVLGILVGIGTGVTQVVNEALLSMHFENRRNRASLLAYAGSTLAALVYPGVLMSLVDAYGLHGALLLTAGLSFNGLAGSVMLRKPTWITADDPDKPILMVVAPEEDLPLPARTTEIVNLPAVSLEGGDQNADGMNNVSDVELVYSCFFCSPVHLEAGYDAFAARSKGETRKEKGSLRFATNKVRDCFTNSVSQKKKEVLSAIVSTAASERPSSGPLVVVCAILTALTLSSAMVLYDYVAVELRQGHATGMGILVTTALGDLLARLGTDAFLRTVSDRRLVSFLGCPMPIL
ncbi:unnamed protein product [Ixodes persulcatus]